MHTLGQQEERTRPSDTALRMGGSDDDDLALIDDV